MLTRAHKCGFQLLFKCVQIGSYYSLVLFRMFYYLALNDIAYDRTHMNHFNANNVITILYITLYLGLGICKKKCPGTYTETTR